jgi:peptidoglycan lytic transglycosylase D
VSIRLGLVCTAVCLVACSGGKSPEPVTPKESSRRPAPQTAVAVAKDSSTANRDTTTIPSHLADSAAAASLPDSVVERLAADSAADVNMLEQLAAAHPDTGDSSGGVTGEAGSHGGANELESAVTWDIDVETYNSHARVQYYLDFFQSTARERMAIWLSRMPRYEPMIRDKLREHGVPEDMVYLALIESGFSNSAVSRSRATGMWQFMKGTGKLYGLRIDSWVDERRDPFRSTDAAARHLADLRDRFGSMYLAAAAYNAGAGKVGRGLKRLGDDEEEEDNPDADFFRLYDTRFLRRETKDYVPKLIAAALIAKQPEKYGFARLEGIEPLELDSVVVPDATGLDVIARLADTTTAAIRELNPQYIRGVTPPKSPSVVRLPLGKGDTVSVLYGDLPAKERITFVEHVVTKGQTLGGIAKIYGVSTSTLAAANPGVKAKSLRTGTRIVVPTSGARLPSTETARPTSTTTVSSSGMYTVHSGESLWSIGQKFNVSVAQLRDWNGLSSTAGLKAGQRIRVKAPGTAAPAKPTTTASSSSGSHTHVVRRGETLSGIAQKYGVSVSALRNANDMDSGSVLKAGEKLTIPN